MAVCDRDLTDHRPSRQRVALAALALVGVLAVSACGDVPEDAAVPADEDSTVGADGDGGDENDVPDGTVDYRDEQASDDEFQAAAERAAAEGQVRVIVGVQVIFTPEGAQSEPANAAQREAIRREQERIIAVLEGTDHAVKRRLDSVPQMALTLSPDAVEALWESGRAASIRLDEAAPPG